jgi:hypothetical protein
MTAGHDGIHSCHRRRLRANVREYSRAVRLQLRQQPSVSYHIALDQLRYLEPGTCFSLLYFRSIVNVFLQLVTHSCLRCVGALHTFKNPSQIDCLLSNIHSFVEVHKVMLVLVPRIFTNLSKFVELRLKSPLPHGLSICFYGMFN